MDPNLLSTVAHLSDDALISRVKHLAAREREATALLIAHLAELDVRRLYLGEGCSSLFTYCTQVLHLSEHAAYGRIEAARAARRFPIILKLLEEGAVTLTTVGLLAAHLLEANHRDLLEAARHRSKRQVEEMVARLDPRPLVPASVRRLPSSRPQVTTPPTDAPEHLATDLEFGGTPVLAALLPSVPATSAPIPARPASVEPLAPERYKVQFTASAETHEKLRQAQALLRHQIPDGDVGAILDRALTALLEQLMKQKVAATNRPRGSATTKPRESSPTPDSRHIPADVRRVVWQRDGGQCAFVSRTGRRCTERGFLEFHHVKPYSAGGEASVQNIELRCRAHNGYAAERAFGQKTSAVRERAEAYVTSERGLADTGSFELGPDRVHLAQPGHVTSAGASRARVPSGMEQADHFTLAAIFGGVGRIRRYSGSEARSRGRPQGDR